MWLDHKAPFDYLYADEVQDSTQAEVILTHPPTHTHTHTHTRAHTPTRADLHSYLPTRTTCAHACMHPSARTPTSTPAQVTLMLVAVGGKASRLFLAGDTAQAVTAGVVFRFSDVRAAIKK